MSSVIPTDSKKLAHFRAGCWERYAEALLDDPAALKDATALLRFLDRGPAEMEADAAVVRRVRDLLHLLGSDIALPEDRRQAEAEIVQLKSRHAELLDHVVIPRPRPAA